MSTPVTRRYALALYEEAAAQGGAVRVDDDVRTLGDLLDGSRELRAILVSPVVPRHKKGAVLGRLLEGRVSELVLRFVRLLLAKEREDQLPAIVRAYNELRDQRENVLVAEVRTPRPLAPDEAESLRRALETQTGRTVRMRLAIEPALLGGLVVRLGDRVYDRSLRHQLGVLRDQLQERAVLSN